MGRLICMKYKHNKDNISLFARPDTGKHLAIQMANSGTKCVEAISAGGQVLVRSLQK
jgi:hypothetical protein